LKPSGGIIETEVSMTTENTTLPVGVTKAKRTSGGKPSAVECWHKCPRHAAMYPAWESLSDEDQIEVGVLWSHPVNAIAKLDVYERLCSGCKEELRANDNPVG
jgi:hypothetical protein